MDAASLEVAMEAAARAAAELRGSTTLREASEGYHLTYNEYTNMLESTVSQ